MLKQPIRLPANRYVNVALVAKSQFLKDPGYYLDWIEANNYSLIAAGGTNDKDPICLSLTDQATEDNRLLKHFKTLKGPFKVSREAFTHAPEQVIELLQQGSQNGEIALGEGRGVVIHRSPATFVFSHAAEFVESAKNAANAIAEGRGTPISQVMEELGLGGGSALKRAAVKGAAAASARELLQRAKSKAKEVVHTDPETRDRKVQSALDDLGKQARRSGKSL